MADDPYLVKPLLGAFRALECLADAPGPLPLPDLAGLAGLSKTTAFRYLRTLAALGYAEQRADGRYSLGPAVNRLGGENARDAALQAVAEPYLLALGRQFGETVNLGVPKGRRIHYLVMLKGDKPQTMQAEAGDSDGLHCTALGKALLAYLPADQVGQHLKAALPRLTPHTIQTRRQLDQALAKVRRFGYAIDREENEIGCVCYAAPVFDQARRPVAAISVSIPLQRLTAELDIALAEAVVATAGALTTHMQDAQARSDGLAGVRSRRGRGRPGGARGG